MSGLFPLSHYSHNSLKAAGILGDNLSRLCLLVLLIPSDFKVWPLMSILHISIMHSAHLLFLVGRAAGRVAVQYFLSGGWMNKLPKAKKHPVTSIPWLQTNSPCSFPRPSLFRNTDFYLFIYLFIFGLLEPHLQHMEVPRLGVESELPLQAVAMLDPSRVCNLYHSSQRRWILNPLSKARDRTHPRGY